MTRIVAISAGLSQPSSTRLLATATRSELGEGTTVEVVELRDYRGSAAPRASSPPTTA